MRTVTIDLAATGGRWPVSAAVARQVGFAMSHALPCGTGHQVIGAPNPFSAASTPADRPAQRIVIERAERGLIRIG